VVSKLRSAPQSCRPADWELSSSWIATGPALARYAVTWDEASLEHASHDEFGQVITAVTGDVDPFGDEGAGERTADRSRSKDGVFHFWVLSQFATFCGRRRLRVTASLSEHSVWIGAGNVGGDPRGRILRVTDELQRVPMLDRHSIGVHLVDVDTGYPRILVVVIQ
jgi:hypothetical protein